MDKMSVFKQKIEDLPDLIPIYHFYLFVGDKVVSTSHISMPIKKNSNKSFVPGETQFESFVNIKNSNEIEDFFNNVNYPVDIEIKLKREGCWSKGYLPVTWNLYKVTKNDSLNEDKEYLRLDFDHFEVKINEENK